MGSRCRGAPAEGRYFDEVFDEHDHPRLHYEAAVHYLRARGRRFLARFGERSRRLTGDMPLTAMPRILTRSEHDLVARGTAQRARAIRAFYEDYMTAQIFRDAVIPGAVIDAIVARSGESLFRSLPAKGTRPRLRAFFGPDVIRAADGGFQILEDNLHFVGGAGDLEPARAAHETLLPGFAAAIGAINDPRAFLDELCTMFHEAADPPIGPGADQGAFVVLGTPPYGDKEDHRLYEMLRARHAVIVEPGMKDRRIEARADGAYLIRKVRVGGASVTYQQKIGFLWMNAEHAWVDSNHPAIRPRALLDEARDHLHDGSTSRRAKKRIRAALRRVDAARLERALRRSNIALSDSVLEGSLVAGLLELMLSGKLQTNATPGIEFLGDKTLHSYVPDLVRLYLDEEPILPNVPTYRLFEVTAGGEVIPDRAAITRVMEDRERYVIKIADGRGGRGVHIGRTTSARKWRALGERALADPTRWTAQDYTHPSVLRAADGGGHRIVDCRFLSMIMGERVFVTGTFWGRSNVLTGDGKVNLSLSGTATVGYVVPDRARTAP